MSKIGNFFWRRTLKALTSEEKKISRNFNKLFYEYWKKGNGTLDTSWLGFRIVKSPNDLWVYQEIISELRPSLIIETGTRFGGSALFFASIFDLLGEGRVISIDIDFDPSWPRHARIEYLTGMSCSEEVIESIKRRISLNDKVMVILDSDHSYENVLEELKIFSNFVTVGQYLVCEDTNLNGNPVRPEFGPGPKEALDEFMGATDRFFVDCQRERFLVSVSPGGYIKRVK